jgi:TonB family protein
MMWPHELNRKGEEVRKQRGVSLAVSLGLHGVAFLVLMEAPAVELPRASESEYRQAISGKEDKIVWYKFRKELPRVTPPVAKKDKRPLRAETVAKQAMVSSPKEAPKRDQMVWAPAPPVVAPPPLESPNVLAIRLPDQPFVAPPDIVKPELARVDVPDAPELKPAETASVSLQAKLPPKPYTAPPARARSTPAVVPLAAEAPQLAASLAPGAGMAGPVGKLPPRPFTAPAGMARTAPAAQPSLEAPSNSKDLNVAIVGLNPLERVTALPSAPSPASFSAGPKLNPNGAVSEGAGKGLSVPDLFVRGPQQNKPDLIAQAHAAPTSAETLRAAMKNGEPMTFRAPEATYRPIAPATATKVSGAPDARFNGRDVFMMAIQMPNLTSYSGSWLMWYADRTAKEMGLAPIAAPVPHRKVDPKYIPAAVEERVEGKVTLGCVVDREGRVSGVELIRGIDSRLNQSAQEALAKWEFYPATQNGLPVEVDVLVEIPFRLAPKPPRR